MHLQNCCFATVRASSHEPGYRDAVLPWVHMRNLIPVSEMRKGQRSWEGLLGPNSRNKANTAKDKKFKFRYHSFGNSTLKAVLYYCSQIQCLWCLCKYSRQCKTMLSRPPQLLALFRPGNRAEVFIWQNFQPTNGDLGNRASPPFLMNTSKILRRILR